MSLTGDGSQPPILGLIVLCCALSALVGALFTSAFWTTEADERAAEAVAQVCPTTTVPATTTTRPAPTTTVPAGDAAPQPEMDPILPDLPDATTTTTTTAPPTTTTAPPAGSRDNPIDAAPPAPTTTLPERS